MDCREAGHRRTGDRIAGLGRDRDCGVCQIRNDGEIGRGVARAARDERVEHDRVIGTRPIDGQIGEGHPAVVAGGSARGAAGDEIRAVGADSQRCGDRGVIDRVAVGIEQSGRGRTGNLAPRDGRRRLHIDKHIGGFSCHHGKLPRAVRGGTRPECQLVGREGIGHRQVREDGLAVHRGRRIGGTPDGEVVGRSQGYRDSLVGYAVGVFIGHSHGREFPARAVGDLVAGGNLGRFFDQSDGGGRPHPDIHIGRGHRNKARRSEVQGASPRNPADGQIGERRNAVGRSGD